MGHAHDRSESKKLAIVRLSRPDKQATQIVVSLDYKYTIPILPRNIVWLSPCVLLICVAGFAIGPSIAAPLVTALNPMKYQRAASVAAVPT